MTITETKSSALGPTIAADSGTLTHTLIRASAGSGKTHQLTTRYLQLVAAGADPSNILASTFTRLAAGEIRDRILTRLAKAVHDENRRDNLAEDLGVSSLTPAQVLNLLASLARRLHLIQIRTLDSFFAGVVKSFALELELPLGADVIDEAAERTLRAEAMRRMLDERDPQQLIDLLRRLTQGTSQRSICSAIDRAVTQLYALWREAPPEAWECVPAIDGRLSPAQIVAAVQKLEACHVGSDRRFIEAHQKACEAARNWRWDAFLSDGLAAKIGEGSGHYYSKAISEACRAAYQPLVSHAQAELVNRAREETIAARDLLQLFHDHFESLKRERRAVTFDDLARAMAKAEQLGSLNDIGFRLDARLHHLLLDEFQDTSISQWQALRPIVDELRSVAPPERTFFCVGDVKQSIYGWRNAAPEVLDHLPEHCGGALEVRDLAKSWRSSPVIMDVVNRAFEALDSNDAMAEHPAVVAGWQAGYRHHETVKTALPGYVELRYCRTPPRDAEDERGLIRLNDAAELTARLHQSNPSMSIALLTRTNSAAARLLYELGASRRNIPSSGRGGGSLTNAAPVNVILDLLQLADHPDDTIAAFNVAASPIARDVGLTKFQDMFERHRIAQTIRKQLLDEGYGRTIARWAAMLAPHADAREIRRVQSLVELADGHDANASLRPRDFIDLVEHQDVDDAQPAPVQVMTIHQAKGLEFDAVILPDLEMPLIGAGTPGVVFEREGEIGSITRICRYMNKGVRSIVPELGPMFDAHTRRTVRESLCVLYVAMTRPRHGLYMLVDEPGTNRDGSPSRQKLKTLAGVVRCALARADAKADEIAFSHGDPAWSKSIPVASSEAAREAEPPRRITLATSLFDSTTISRGWSAAPASAASHSTVLAQSLRQIDDEPRDRGIAMHALFQQIEWLDQSPLDELQLRASVLGIAPRRGKTWADSIVQQFRTAIEKPSIRSALSLNGADAGLWRLHRELPFARLVDGRVQRGAIDRLVIEMDSRRKPQRATVIDFKTDEIDASAAKAHAERYRPQLEVYRAAAAEMFGLNMEDVAARLIFVSPGVIVDSYVR